MRNQLTLTLLLLLCYSSFSQKFVIEDELSIEQNEQNTKHSQKRVCNEHTMKGIKRLRIVKDILRLDAYKYADKLFINACSLHNFRVKSPLRAHVQAGTHVSKHIFT